MHGASHRLVARQVDVDRPASRQRLDLTVERDLVVDAGSADEVGVAGRGEADQLRASALAEEEGRDQRGLARGARDEDRLASEEPLRGEEVVDQERGVEEGPEEALLTLTVGIVGGVGVSAPVALVRGRQSGAVRGRVDEAAPVDAVGNHHELRGQREIAEHARPLFELGGATLRHLGEAPDRQLAPALLRGEEPPVAHRVAEEGVGHVVGRQPEGLDPQQRLALGRLRSLLVREAVAAQVVCGDEEVHSRSLRAGAYAGHADRAGLGPDAARR